MPNMRSHGKHTILLVPGTGNQIVAECRGLNCIDDKARISFNTNGIIFSKKRKAHNLDVDVMYTEVLTEEWRCE